MFDRSNGLDRSTLLTKLIRHRDTFYAASEEGFFHLQPTADDPGSDVQLKSHTHARPQRPPLAHLRR